MDVGPSDLKESRRKAGAKQFFEDTISGLRSYRDRRQLGELLSLITAGDEVVVFALSRATRSLPDLLELVALLI
jgi:DNA invertase Pin-like site-specific DNA recombinase